MRRSRRSELRQDSSKDSRLPPAARRRGLLVLLVSTFFAWGGFFMVIPMISVHFVDGLGWTAGAVGLVLAARQFFQQGLTPFSGVLADRLGAKPLIAIGMIVRAVGFAAMGFAETYELLDDLGDRGRSRWRALRVAALGRRGGADRRKRALDLLRQDRRRRGSRHNGRHAARGVTAGSGFPARFVGQRGQLRADPGHDPALATGRTGGRPGGPLLGLRLAFRDRTFLSYTGFMGGHWFMSAQFSITLPLVAAAISGNASAVAWVYAVNSAVAVVLGYPMPRLVERRFGARWALIGGVVLTAAGLIFIGFSRDIISSARRGLCLLSGDRAGSTDRAGGGLWAGVNPVALGSYFGVASLAVAFGGGLGNYAGGVLYDVGEHLRMPALPWLDLRRRRTGRRLRPLVDPARPKDES